MNIECKTPSGVFFHAQKEVALTITEKQKAFVEEYLVDLNATRAYKAVYKSCKKDETARVNGSRLLTNANVAEYLAKRRKDMQKRTEVTQDRVIQELAAIAFSDILDYVSISDDGPYSEVVLTPTKSIPTHKRAAIAGIKQGANGIEVKLYDKLVALDKLGQHLGLFNNNDIDNDSTADDGFIDALDGKVSEVWADGKRGDIPLSAVQ